MEFLPNQPTLCLNMIVKNESRIIERLFNSVSKLIDVLRDSNIEDIDLSKVAAKALHNL